jgi:DNA mismatch endonuclease (patch repair protein)
MTDVHSPKTRSYNMSRIRGKDTKPELIVWEFLFSKNFRYRVVEKLITCN